jgi:hypothetical protein
VTGEVSGLVNVLDILAIVNWITLSGGNPHLPPAGDALAMGYVDVDNNGICNLLDVLAVVNYITLHNSQGGGGGGGGFGDGEGETAGGFRGGEETRPGGEGENLMAGLAPPATAAEYYARSPLHFLEIPGTDLPCCCSSCLSSQGNEPSNAAAAADLTVIPASSPLGFLDDDGHDHGEAAVGLAFSREDSDPRFGFAFEKRLPAEDNEAAPMTEKYSLRRVRIEQAIDELAAEVATSLPKIARLLD